MTAKTPDFSSLQKDQNFTFSVKKKKKSIEEEEEEKKKKLFYSQCLLSSKGPLRVIWVAGYFFKRLKKRQIIDTDISSSVDKILLEGLPSVTYRILAYLLLGVVRIYSKKVEFLIQDCHEAVSDVNRFSVGKKVVSFRDIVRPSPSITLPEKYELDSFQLEVADSARKCNIVRNEDISIQGKGVSSQYSLDELRFEEDSNFWEDLWDAPTSYGLAMQQETCLSSQTPDKFAAEQKTSTYAHTPPDKVLSPHRMEIDVEVNSPDHMKNFKTSKEKLRELNFFEEEGMDFDRCELDVELLKLINEYQVQNTDNMDEVTLRKAPLENEAYDTLKEKEVLYTTEKTHDPDVAITGVTGTPEFTVVLTPVKKYKIQRPGKRKCMIDETTTMLNSEKMIQDINDASDLVCKRRKAPHTVIDLWRSTCIPALPKRFLEPSIPCVALELESVHFGAKTERSEASEPFTSQAAKPIESTQASVKQQDSSSPVTPSAPIDRQSIIVPVTPVQCPIIAPGTPVRYPIIAPGTPVRYPIIAPGTPIQCPTSARVFGSCRATDSDGEGVHSYENMKESSVNVEAEDSFCPSLIAEMDEVEGDSQELHKNKNGGLSARTRIVARYLHRVIQRKKQQGVETVTLLPIVERKTKRENAMLFFEVLALSTGGFINVVQEKAFSDIILQETPHLEEVLKGC